MQNVVLYYSDLATGGSSDKEYRTQIVKQGNLYSVLFQYGRRGGTLQSGSKTSEPVSLEEAEKIFNRLVAEKTSKGYVETGEKSSAPAVLTESSKVSRTRFPRKNLTEVNQDDAEFYVMSPQYVMQRKYDGEFRQAEKLPDGSVISYSKLGEAKPFPKEVAEQLAQLPLNLFFTEGELVGNVYAPWDIFEADGDISTLIYAERSLILEKAISKAQLPNIASIKTWRTLRAKQAALAELKSKRAEGAVFKKLSTTYRDGGHVKFKFLKSCSAKVVDMGVKNHNNAVLALLADGKWREVGRVSMNGKDSRIKIGSIVEITFLYVGAGGRLYQPRIKEMRTDIKESECTFDQLEHAYKEGIVAA